MGEAKRRGSADLRTEEAKRKKIASMSKMAERINVQVDEDLYLYCSNIYSAAAQMTMPVENPENKKIHIKGTGTFSFTDNPTNRGMLAVTQELREQGIDEEIRMSMGIRIMQFGDVLTAKDRFTKWIRPSGDGDSLDVAEALIRACAKAKIVLADDDMYFDLDDVERHATVIEDRIETEENSKAS
jgi:hypothetical protein